MRYVIDFYTGKSSAPGGLAFYLDVQPALDSWGAVKMRSTKFVESWLGPMPWTTKAPAAANNSGQSNRVT